MGRFFIYLYVWSLGLAVLPLAAMETERVYLSGTGIHDAVPWDFYCTAGRRSGFWTTIPVPSHWEQHGFGTYNYGHDEKKSQEQGIYRYRFQAPEAWRGRRVRLVFDGVMTDADVRLNGETTGPVHQGAFYRFHREVSGLLRFGQTNRLEVTVSKQSANKSVNLAERQADYWVFGGIFRPVFLEALPAEGIERLAIDARHDGQMRVEVQLFGLAADAVLTSQVETLAGEPVGPVVEMVTVAGQELGVIEGRIDAPKAWSAESPNLYRLRVELRRQGQLLHRVRERFGFRTVEVRPGLGLLVNGRRVRLKGVNRHAFWPESGRAMSRQLDRRDVELIRQMNFNAVRASHYPPDKGFLDACDELGLYVLDELAGWHDAYDTQVGTELIREMVQRDVNHPSILFWNNGNEGGWNKDLDEVFHQFDPQKRTVLRPHSLYGGFQTFHYASWKEWQGLLDPQSWKNQACTLLRRQQPLVMATEILHGLYDGGSGAGLSDYWTALRQSPQGVGIFLWSMIDEAIERTDQQGALDTDGNHAPDGVLGPYRETTGNYYTVREIFSPIQVSMPDFGPSGGAFDGRLQVENRYDFTSLEDCRFTWSLWAWPAPGAARWSAALASGELRGPELTPGRTGYLRLPNSSLWEHADALRLTASGPDGREVWTWVWPLQSQERIFDRFLIGEASATVLEAVDLESSAADVEPARSNDNPWLLQARSTRAEFDPRNGSLLRLSNILQPGFQPMEFRGGPRVVVDAKNKEPKMWVRRRTEGEVQILETMAQDGSRVFRWALYPSGWLRLSFQYEAPGRARFHGVTLDYPENRLQAMRWLGPGPARVWRNRLHGGTLGVWEKSAAEESTPTSANEPKFKGYYADPYWLELSTEDGPLTVVFETRDLYFGMMTPAFADDSVDAVAQVPEAGLSFLRQIPAIGTKFHPAEDLGPSSERPGGREKLLHRGAVWIYPGKIPLATPKPTLTPAELSMSDPVEAPEAVP